VLDAKLPRFQVRDEPLARRELNARCGHRPLHRDRAGSKRDLEHLIAARPTDVEGRAGDGDDEGAGVDRPLRARMVHDVEARLSGFETDRGSIGAQLGDTTARARLERDVAAVGEAHVGLLGRRGHEEVVVVGDLRTVDFEGERRMRKNPNAGDRDTRNGGRGDGAERPPRDPLRRRCFR
jgi:hypothetical protein